MRKAPVPDLAARRRAARETGRSFMVEAAAGTGKTKTLIDRIVHYVLQSSPGNEPLRLSQIASITFTEKAAGEMKIRLREEFEKFAARAGRTGERARQALRDLETAFVSTIHSFAVSMLKERPIEAGLDPRFRALDAVESDLLFRDSWNTWLSRAIQERRRPLERALRAGISIEQLRLLANELRLHARAIEKLQLARVSGEEEVRNRIGRMRERGESYRGFVKNSADKLAMALESVNGWLRAGPGADLDIGKMGNVGSQGNWRGGASTVSDVRDFVREAVELRAEYLLRDGQLLLEEVVRWLQDEILSKWMRLKRERGLLDFDDQLARARDLLRSHPAAREGFQGKYKTLLVDEFQDTDPVQLEIALLLSSTDLNENDPAKLRPYPGRLFIVGDPKQSIYRFRGADIETYLHVEAASTARNMEVLSLRHNFRSVPSILNFVDRVFSESMEASEGGFYQPRYQEFGGGGARSPENDAPAVHILSNLEQGLEAFNSRTNVEDESRRIARLMRSIVVERRGKWKVWVSREGPGSPRSWQEPRFGDIAVLLPVFTKVDILEDALREAEIPYVLEGGKFYYARGEVSSAITILRAIDNPGDAVALYGALRSVFFGLSDEDLLRLKVNGLRLDYREEIAEDSPCRGPFALLYDLHRLRHIRPPSETFESLLHRTGVREVLAGRPGGMQSIANLNKLARTLRARQVDLTFSEAVDLLSGMDEEELDETESRVMEERSDAVRVLSIHRSKGLDFPIVFVAGLGIQRKPQSPMLLSDPHDKKVFAVSFGSRESRIRSPEWNELKERDDRREDAELVRLLYVALTRARDHLVVSTHLRWRKNKNGPARPDPARTRLAPILFALGQTVAEQSVPLEVVDVRKLDMAELRPASATGGAAPDRAARLGREYEELERIRKCTPVSRAAAPPTGLEGEGAEDLAISRAWPVRLGSAFHEAMQLADLSAGGVIRQLAEAAAQRHGMHARGAREIEGMMSHCWNSKILERAREALRAGKRVERELPFVRPVEALGGQVLVEQGVIDLALEETEGWVVVDYKTDGIPKGKEDIPAYFRGKYAAQIEEYAAALRQLGLTVKGAYLLLARSGDSIEIDV